jgi:hypothetical protein
VRVNGGEATTTIAVKSATHQSIYEHRRNVEKGRTREVVKL